MFSYLIVSYVLSVICAEVLNSDAMKEAKLLRHFESKRKDFRGKYEYAHFFSRVESELKSARKSGKHFPAIIVLSYIFKNCSGHKKMPLL